ncbi:hypothetical protein EN805_34805, partial [bacterium M00.F.Ca.ET.162.01.1.1]
GQLRRIDSVKEVRAFIEAEAETAARFANPADEMVRRMGRRANAQRQIGEFDTIGFRILDERLASITAIQAGCERIAGTPLPFAYTLLVHRTAY